ncbi:rab-GTPase-TBC domain-containing protein [Daldinia decipiens]|uniref:rab-GTPase-TBC domain-containing protein n=1 Tax=Daldinia decipiens TaxID=326647 RepID=UPI0020C24479|nr:rab-GTPase-TBC domain-containing protein [Daldinia decipiens]KAI1657462.1 rab-GTPase-TBC domain-containing protein [Daldinia decipiens]
MFGVTPHAVPCIAPPAPPKTTNGRTKSRSSSLVPFRDDSKLVAFRYDQTVQAEPPIPIPPPRSSRRPPPRPISCNTARIPIVVPPPRPAPPTEQHPALRTISSPRTNVDARKRDSCHSPTTPSSSWTIREDSETDDEDPFTYEKVKKLSEIRPLQLATRSASPSLYSRQEERVSESNSRASAPSPALSDGDTISPTSPNTPPSNFSKRFARSFSLRSNSSKSSFSKMKRLRKKVGKDGVPRAAAAENPGYPLNGQDESAPKSPKSPKPPSGRLSPVPDPHGSPVISTAIPTERLLEDDFMTQLSFSKRGSLIFGAKHPRKPNRNPPKMAEQHGIIDNGTAGADRPREPRAFPLIPTREKAPDAAVGASASANEPAKFSGASDDALTSTPPTPRRLPPSVRVISAEAEKESQKVRSLYESGEGVKWEEGARHSSIDERIQPSAEDPAEDPSEDNANDASNDQAGHLTPVSASTSLPPDNDVRREYELAGGIEDWEGVQVEDVDRYGFISVQQPQDSRPSSPTGTTTSVHFSMHKQRNVLFRKETASRSLRVRSGPSRKMSTRSLNTQASELSTASHRSALSATFRQATNLLPHNRDRKLLDEAGDILATHPGLSHITEDGSAERKLTESKLKETQRAEKWLRMATVTKAGEDGQGMVFDFDLKHPKLVKRVWKGIPDCWRAAAWYSFLSTAAKASGEPSATEEEIKAEYHRLAEEPSPDDGQIDLDVPRTINQHIMFRRRYRGGQRLLFRVLHALSLYFPDTGYVQGMAPLAATFLSYFDEEMCFVMLVRLWKYRGLNRMYGSGFVALIEALKDFENDWLASRDVASKLTELCIDPTAYATKWYLTLFNLSIPFPVQLRVWDAFILLGSSPEPTDGTTSPNKAAPEPSSKGLEILHATSLAIIDTLRPTLLDSDFENAMKSLTSWVPIKDEQGFMDLVQLEYRRHEGKQKA